MEDGWSFLWRIEIGSRCYASDVPCEIFVKGRDDRCIPINVCRNRWPRRETLDHWSLITSLDVWVPKYTKNHTNTHKIATKQQQQPFDDSLDRIPTHTFSFSHRFCRSTFFRRKPISLDFSFICSRRKLLSPFCDFAMNKHFVVYSVSVSLRKQRLLVMIVPALCYMAPSPPLLPSPPGIFDSLETLCGWRVFQYPEGLNYILMRPLKFELFNPDTHMSRKSFRHVVSMAVRVAV